MARGKRINFAGIAGKGRGKGKRNTNAGKPGKSKKQNNAGKANKRGNVNRAKKNKKNANKAKGKGKASSKNLKKSNEPIVLKDVSPNAKKLHLPIFKILNKAHARGGVKEGEYMRYHRTCTSNLRNLRRYLGLIQIAGTAKNARFHRIEITPKNCRSAKQMLIAFMEAERAWAHAMRLQTEISEHNLRKRQHMCRRLTRAARYSKFLLRIAQARGDEATQLQSQVYEGFLRGSVCIQKENWSEAAAAFGPALAVCEALGRVSRLDLQAMCEERASQLRLYADFAADRLGRLDPQAKAEMDLRVSTLVADDILQSKLQAVHEASAKQQTTAMRFVVSRGVRLEVRNEKLRLLLVGALAVLNQIRDQEDKEESASSASSSTTRGLSINALFNRALSIYDDAILAIKDSIRERGNVRTRSEQIDNEVRNLRALLSYVELLRLQTSLQRNIRNANSMRARVNTSLSGVGSSNVISEAGEESHGGNLRPAAIVTVYDRLIQNINDLEQSAIADIDYDKPEQKQSADAIKSLSNARRQGFQAFRVYYLACAHGAEGNAMECAGLLSRALERCEEAERLLQAELNVLSKDDSEQFFTKSDLEPELQSLSTLKLRISSEAFKAKAKAILEQELLAEQIQAAHLQKQQQQHVEGEQSSTLLGRLNKYSTGAPGRQYDIVAFPPKLASVAPKPTLFDLSINGIVYPDFSTEAGIERKPDESSPEDRGEGQSEVAKDPEQAKSVWSRFSFW